MRRLRFEFSHFKSRPELLSIHNYGNKSWKNGDNTGYDFFFPHHNRFIRENENRKFQRRFENSLSSFKDKDLKEIFYKFLSLGKDNAFLNPVALTLIIMWLVCGYAVYSFTSDWTNWWLLIIVGIVFFSGIAAAFLLIGLGYLIVRLSEVIIDGIFNLILLLFNKLKLEGAMLIMGAGIFLLSKIISLTHSSPK